MRVYKLTKKGKNLVKVPGLKRSNLLDHLYQFKVATLDELLAIDKNARTELAKLIKAGYVEELSSA